MIFEGALPRENALAVVEALLDAGADVNFRANDKCDTPLIGAASLGAEEVGVRLLNAGANAHLKGMFGETALHWAAMLGEEKLASRLIEGADLNLEDERYHSPPLGWAVHGWCNPPAGNHGRQREVVSLLVKNGATVRLEWLEEEQVRADATMLAALRGSAR
jgi:hypothetical protein